MKEIEVWDARMSCLRDDGRVTRCSNDQGEAALLVWS
jgi:hypothetical protein